MTTSASGSLLQAAGLVLGGVAAAAATERRTELIRYNDVQIEVVFEGSGPAVVLLPSLARDSDDYDEVAEGLAAAGFRVLRPKPRGIGRSTGPMTGISLHDFARDIAEVVKKLGGGKAVVVGHAYGNWVARMTADRPSRPGSRRGDCRSRCQAICTGTLDRCDQRGKSFAYRMNSALLRCALGSSRRATIRLSG